MSTLTMRSFTRMASVAVLFATAGTTVINAQLIGGHAAHTPAPTNASMPSSQVASIANPRLDTWVARFSGAMKGELTAALSRGRSYVSMISDKLAARQMPHELAYL